MYVRTFVSVTLRNVAVTSRRNVANQRSYVIIIARKEGGAWECIIIGSTLRLVHKYDARASVASLAPALRRSVIL